MLSYVENNDELALIIGHELSHNTLGHNYKKYFNTLIGTALGATFDIAVEAAIEGATGYQYDSYEGVQAGMEAGMLFFSQEFELEADYAGVYYAARAGYDVSTAAALWRRMAEENPAAIHTKENSTHPSTAERFVRIQTANEEIERKRAEGIDLIPERRKKKE